MFSSGGSSLKSAEDGAPGPGWQAPTIITTARVGGLRVAVLVVCVLCCEQLENGYLTTIVIKL